jgi:hypothetical protein
MAPHNNGGADDFVLVDAPVDAAVDIVTLQDALGDSPIESGYVTVSTSESITPAKQDTIVTAPTPAPTPVPSPVDPKQRMVEIKNFQPMPLSAFPDELMNTLLIGHLVNKQRLPSDQVSVPSSPAYPYEFLIKNGILLLDCFIHFKDLYAKIGRDNMLYTVGRACEMNWQGSTSLKQDLSLTLDTLAAGRTAFLRTGDVDADFWKPENVDVQVLAWLAQTYAHLKLQEPETVDKSWFRNPAIRSPWSAWQRVLNQKRQAFINGENKTGKDNFIYSDVHSLTP